MMIWMCGAFSENVIGFPRKSSGVDDDKAMQDHITLDEVECAGIGLRSKLLDRLYSS